MSKPQYKDGHFLCHECSSCLGSMEDAKGYYCRKCRILYSFGQSQSMGDDRRLIFIDRPKARAK